MKKLVATILFLVILTLGLVFVLNGSTSSDQRAVPDNIAQDQQQMVCSALRKPTSILMSFTIL